MEIYEIKEQLREIADNQPRTVDQYCKMLNTKDDFGVNSALSELESEGLLGISQKLFRDKDGGLILITQYYRLPDT